MTVKLAHIKWRDGRPRLVHGPEDGARGFVDRDLKGDDGAWFTYEQAARFSEDHHQKIVTARAEGKRIRRTMPARPANVEDLLLDWLASPEVQNLAPASVASYGKAGAR